MADVAVPVNRDARDVKDGADDTQPHEEAADLGRRMGEEGHAWGYQGLWGRLSGSSLSLMNAYHALSVTQRPLVVEEGVQNQGVWVEGHHEVRKRQTDHKDITCEGETKREREAVILKFHILDNSLRL